MQSSFDDWADTLTSVLPGASLPNIRLVFWNTAREFYLRSRAWREQLGAFTLSPGQVELPLNPVTQNTEVCYLEGVHLVGAPIFMRVGSSPSFYVEGQYTPGTPSKFELLDPHTLVMSPAPNRTFENALWLQVSVQPTRGAEALPPFARTHHFQALEVGTLGKFLAQPNKPWSEPQSAILHQRRFEVAIMRARADAEKGYSKSANNWQFNTVSIR
jgi:hypothetical protein